jgi:hypothetical protein
MPEIRANRFSGIKRSKYMKLSSTSNDKTISFKFLSLTTALLLSVALSLIGGLIRVSAHGGEDHGDEKPKTETTTKGTVSHTSRVGDLELMVKHPELQPDTTTTGRLFVTQFASNAPAEKATPTVELESANGAVTQAAVEKTDAVGSFLLKIPALPAGTYTMRAKLTFNGETDTATFSGVEVKAPGAVSSEGFSSWARTALGALAALFVLSLFGALVYFAFRGVRGEQQEEAAVGKQTQPTTAAA